MTHSMNVTILNIGLGPSKARHAGTSLGAALDATLRVFRSAHVEFLTIQDGEPVLVVVVQTAAATGETIHRLSERLGQDCIAVIGPAFPNGALIGPEMQSWGAFDRSKFVLPRRFVAF